MGRSPVRSPNRRRRRSRPLWWVNGGGDYGAGGARGWGCSGQVVAEASGELGFRDWAWLLGSGYGFENGLRGMGNWDIAMEYVEPVVGIANCLGTPVCKYLQYHRKMNDYVTNFKKMRDELNCKMEDIELQLKAELLRSLGKIPKKGVENWLKDVKEMIREAQAVENKVRNGSYLCRACNGKLVDEKTQEMKGFLDKAPNASEGLAIDGSSAGLPLPTSELVGEEAVRNEIWACLMQEEVSKIGV
ncbi:hypothetical protein PVK06_017997 [Gossypium arboreum]|uniref:Uncharacterized protein n=1 Tax=Gossypium arboreum TaxID=29729 RepID=A0ABR0Q557_GOSAR|nr:hypothetical protein PVK06_017997 [Gossypium arboreum]